ncbi:hypothetical protein MMJ01_11230, partial [Enterococcus cecorum]
MKIENFINDRIKEIVHKVEKPIIILKGINPSYFDEKDRYFSFKFNYIDKLDVELNQNIII